MLQYTMMYAIQSLTRVGPTSLGFFSQDLYNRDPKRKAFWDTGTPQGLRHVSSLPVYRSHASGKGDPGT